MMGITSLKVFFFAGILPLIGEGDRGGRLWQSG